MRYHRSGLSLKQLILLILIFLVIAIIAGKNREQAARDCIANGGQWVAVARDYHTCIGGNSGK